MQYEKMKKDELITILKNIEVREKNKIESPKGAILEIKKMKIDYNQENFIVVALNSKNQAIDLKVIFKGGLDSCTVDPRVIFKYLFSLQILPTGFIVAHNHPSGSVEPSIDDKKTTERLQNASKILGFTFIDSLILTSSNRNYSLLHPTEIL